MRQVDRDDAAPRCIEVGAEIEARALVSDEAVVRVEIVEQLERRGGELGVQRVLQVDDLDPVAAVGAEPQADHEIAPVLGHVPRHSPVGVLEPLVDELVG